MDWSVRVKGSVIVSVGDVVRHVRTKAKDHLHSVKFKLDACTRNQFTLPALR